MEFSLLVLLASATFCAFIALFLVLQKNGYLKHKLFTIGMLFSSILFCIAASTYCYYEVQGFYDRKNNYGYDLQNPKENIKEPRFTASELDALEDYIGTKNDLIGYEHYLADQVANSDPAAFAYQNIIKEELIDKLQNEAYSQAYWDKILKVIFAYNANEDTLMGSGYNVIDFVPVKYMNRDITYDNSFGGEYISVSGVEYVELVSIVEHCERTVYSFDRSTQNIDHLWQTNKQFIYTFFSKSTYDKVCKEAVDELIEVYETVTGTPGYEAFYQVYNERDSLFLTFPNEEYTASYFSSWPFGFWDRRFEEENAETCYKVLKELQEHYKG